LLLEISDLPLADGEDFFLKVYYCAEFSVLTSKFIEYGSQMR